MSPAQIQFVIRARREQPKRKGKVSDLLTMFGGKRGVRHQAGPPAAPAAATGTEG